MSGVHVGIRLSGDTSIPVAHCYLIPGETGNCGEQCRLQSEKCRNYESGFYVDAEIMGLQTFHSHHKLSMGLFILLNIVIIYF
jgi:hypothetical protein